MALVQVPQWTAVPPFPLLSDRRLGTYNSKAYAFANHLSTVFMQELGVLMESVYQNALWAQNRAAAAEASATTATQQADAAMGYRNTAGNYATTATQQADAAMGYRNTAGNHATTATQQADAASASAATATQQAGLADAARVLAQQARDNAQAYRDQAQVFATQQLKASSTSNLAPGAGNKAFAIEPGRSFVNGMYLVATSLGAPQNQMSGPVYSHDGATGELILAVDTFKGTAARSDWVIGVAVPASAAGLTRQTVNANTQCVAGVAYIVTAAGITLTMPAAWTVGDRIAVIEAIGPGNEYIIAWGNNPVRGRVLGTQTIQAAYGSTGELVHINAAQGLT